MVSASVVVLVAELVVVVDVVVSDVVDVVQAQHGSSRLCGSVEVLSGSVVVVVVVVVVVPLVVVVQSQGSSCLCGSVEVFSGSVVVVVVVVVVVPLVVVVHPGIVWSRLCFLACFFRFCSWSSCSFFIKSGSRNFLTAFRTLQSTSTQRFLLGCLTQQSSLGGMLSSQSCELPLFMALHS